MKKTLFLLLFLSLQLQGHSNDRIFSKMLNLSQLLQQNQSRISLDGNQNIVEIFQKKRIKKLKSPFKIKSNSSSYEKDYNENFLQLIENFLLKHLKKIVKQHKSLESEVENYRDNNPKLNSEEFTYKLFQDLKNKYTLTKTTTKHFAATSTSTFSLHNKFKNCNLNSSKIDGKQALVKCDTTRKQTSTRITTKNVTIKARVNTETSEKTFNDLKQVVIFYKRNFSYFVSTLIILSTISVVLLIITFTCCIIVCKQRSSLNAYNDNEFFTYYNRNLPIVASVSSFSLTGNTKDRIDRMVDKSITNSRFIYDVNPVGSKEALLSNTSITK